MAPDGLRPLLATALILCLSLPANARPGAEEETQTTILLAVQRALQEGRDQLRAGNYRAAVVILEREVPRINGNRDYLRALADAYRGYLRELHQDGRPEEAARYRERLDLLDPAPALKRQAASANPAAATAPTRTEGPAATRSTPSLPTVPEPASPGLTARARLEEKADDPFAAQNSRPSSTAVAAVDRAEDAFRNGRYAVALRLYEEAAHADKESLKACRDRWAYCKLWSVKEGLNRPGADSTRSSDLEREVRQALSLAPGLNGVGEDLLRKIADRKGATVSVRHTPRQGQWEVAETVNFRVFHNQGRELAERVARAAETTRSEMIRKWFDDDTGSWQPRCDVFVYATAQEYCQATGVPATSPGHSYLEQDGGRVTVRKMHLHGDDANMLVGVLPHETTHVVLCGRFGSHQVPRWADEGIAVLAEPRDRVERHLQNLPQHKRDRQLFPVGQLMRLNDYPDPRYIGSFYAESVSLVEFLAQREGPRVFSRFLRDGLQGNYEEALRRHYHVESFAELDRLWQQEALGATRAAAAGNGH